MLFTYSDIVSHLVDYMRDQNTTATKRFAKRAASDGLRELANINRWNYYRTHGRISTSASYNTGTVVFDYTGGAYERMLTLSGGTWPAWIEDGVVLINSIPYDVEEQKSSTVITLMAASNPGADVASTEYTAYRDAYPTPVDMVDVEKVICLERDQQLCYVTPGDWLGYQSYFTQPTNVWYYTILGDPNYQGAMSFRLAGAPSSAETLEFLYRRRPRPLRYYEYNTGTVTNTAESTTITGTGTTFSAFMAGSVIRLYDTSNYPTNEEGDYPAYVERTITSVTSTTVLTVDAEIPDAYTGVKYVITDPIDIDKQVMANAYKRTCEKLVEQTRQGKNLPQVAAMWQSEIKMAIGADKRFAGTVVAGSGYSSSYGSSLSDNAIVEFD